MSVRKLLRTLQSEYSPLKPVKDACVYYSQKAARRPGDPDFAALRFLPDSLPGCYLDIGANQGQSIEAIRLFKPRARIHAFEPNPQLAAALARRHRRRPLITVHAYGLAETAQTARLYTPVYKGFAYDGLASLDRESAATWLGPETLYAFSPRRLEIRESVCRTAPLDGERLDPVFIKIDVQGAEYQVVRGGLQTLERCDPVLMIEDLSHRPRLAALLRELGYEQYRFDGGGLYRAADESAVNFLLMTRTRAATVTAAPGRGGKL